MAAKKRTKTFYAQVNSNVQGFVTKLIQDKSEIDLSDIKILRTLLSNEKAKILYTIKNKKPKSIYDLAKILKRDFKSVKRDLQVLERFGFVEFFSEKYGNRESLRPILTADRIEILIDI